MAERQNNTKGSSVLQPHLDRITSLYLTDQKTYPEIGTVFGVSGECVRRLLRLNGVPSIPPRKGPANKNWKGSAIGYQAQHQRVRLQRGTAHHCEVCGLAEAGKRYEWANLTGNHGDVADYQQMCKKCHEAYDRARRPVRTSCWMGHPYDYRTKDGSPVCLECQRRASKKKYKTFRQTNPPKIEYIEFDGLRLRSVDWARRLGIDRSTLCNRLKNWPMERALTEPPNPSNAISNEQLADLESLYTAGVPIKELAVRFARTEGNVWHLIRRRLHIPARGRLTGTGKYKVTPEISA